MGIGFAIPSSMARSVMDQLIEYGEVRRGTLGLVVQDLTPELAGAFSIESGQGVLVAEVVTGSAADEGGLQPGDIILRMEKSSINSSQDFHNAEGRLAIGDSLKIEYLRKGKKRDTRLVIQSVPFLNGADVDYRLEGARFVDLTPRQKKQNISGILLDNIDPGSRLARQGLAEGDIIIGANRQQISNLVEFKKVVEIPRSPLLLQVLRGSRVAVVRID